MEANEYMYAKFVSNAVNASLAVCIEIAIRSESHKIDASKHAWDKFSHRYNEWIVCERNSLSWSLLNAHWQPVWIEWNFGWICN